MSESGLTAQMVIPMALSLAFGIMFATGLTLFFIPCLYLMLDDLRIVNNKATIGIKRLIALYCGKTDSAR